MNKIILGLLISSVAFAQPFRSGNISTNNGLPDNQTTRVKQAERRAYSVVTTAKTAVAAGTAPFFSMCGSVVAGNLIRIQTITVGVTVATAAVYADIAVVRTSTATTLGTATTLTAGPHDSSNAVSAATAIKLYTVAPTAGTAAARLGSKQVFAPITGTPANGPGIAQWDWSLKEFQQPVLRTSVQCLELSFTTTTTNAPTVTVEVTWTEE